jgi:phospholipase/carboxylesterase
MPIRKTVFGGLTTYVVSELAPDERPELAVVLCHGFGATGRDLVGLVQPLAIIDPELVRRAVFLFPAGPLDLADFGIPYGRAWWMIDLDRLLNNPTPELLARFRREPPEGLAEARQMLAAMIDEACAELGLWPERLILGGFSQGSMVTTDLALRMAQGPAGLAILSGALINEREWRELAAARADRPLAVLQSHGRDDNILMYPQGIALRDLLVEVGHQVDFVPFTGGPEIPLEVARGLAALCRRGLEK